MDFSPSSFRAARALLNLGQGQVASAAGVGPRVVIRLEDVGYPDPTEAALKVHLYYRNQGLEFLDATSTLGPGVRWRKPGREDFFNRRQIHAGRVLLDWRQVDFATKLDVTRSLLAKFESGIKRKPTQAFVESALKTLEAGGVVMLEDDEHCGFGVRLAQPLPSRGQPPPN
ncbi:helix-turn-helix domain-containing protein [Neorhizobium galegae]|uniref:helix-turn-helix domain-containing protein n=1 Tax=Neorhizobium galegae TaxID=399 RepID=UPI00351D9876